MGSLVRDTSRERETWGKTTCHCHRCMRRVVVEFTSAVISLHFVLHALVELSFGLLRLAFCRTRQLVDLSLGSPGKFVGLALGLSRRGGSITLRGTSLSLDIPSSGRYDQLLSFIWKVNTYRRSA